MTSVNNRRFRVGVALAALVAIAMPMVFPGQKAQAAQKVLRWSNIGEPLTIDPQQASYSDQIAWVRALDASLLRYDDKANPESYIAKEVPTTANGGISADGKTYTYHLNDWNWSDGKGQVTAGDFVYSFERLVDPKAASPYGNFFNGIIANAQEIQNGKVTPDQLGVKAVDDKTLQFTLVKAVGYFNQMVSTWLASPVRKDNVERSGLSTPAAWTDPANGEVVGSGPFMITKWDHGSDMVFDKNPNYSGTPAKVDEVQITLQDDPAVQYASFQAGQLDVSGIPLAEVDNAKKDPTLSKEFTTYTELCTWYLRMNTTKAPFDNVKVRQAFNYAIDRDTFINVVNKGIGKKTFSFIPPGMFGYDASAGKEYDYNPTMAKKLLADAGYPDGKGFPHFPYNYSAGASNQVRAEWFQAQLKQVLNVDVDLQPMEGSAYQAATSDLTQKIEGVGRSGWCADYPHPADWFGLVFAHGDKNGNDLTGFNDPDFNKLSDAADSELDQTKAAADYKAVQNLLLKDAPVVFIYNDVYFFMKGPNVTGLLTDPLDGGMPGTQYWEQIDVK